jgi:hypothetical protein
LTNKAISEAERRAELEAEALKKEAREEKKRQKAEAEALALAKTIYENIWLAFSKDWVKGRSFAYANLLQNLTKCASELVPHYMTAKEHMAMVTEAAGNVQEGSHTVEDDPRELIGKWIAGEAELSRIPLGKVVQ